MERVLDAVAAGKAEFQGLLRSPAYAEALQGLPRMRTLVYYNDSAKGLGVLEGIGSMPMGELPLDLGKLPVELLQKYLRPDAGVLHHVEDGFLAVSRMRMTPSGPSTPR